jgi:preprotein translocase subunit SecD
MARRNGLWLFGLIILFILALLVVFPVNKGVIGGRSIRLGLDLQGGTRIVYTANMTGIPESDRASDLAGTIAVLENRINPLGVSETSIRMLGSDQIVVEIPGRTLTAQEKESLARVALLEFGELITDNSTTPRWTDVLGNWKPTTATVDNQTLELTSAYFQDNTYVTRDQLGNVLLMFNWNSVGTKLSEAITSRLIDQPLGIFEGDQPLLDESGRPVAPTVKAVISSQGQIEGLSFTEANRLSRQLNAGRLPVPLIRTGDEQDIPPLVGEAFISLSIKAGIVAFAAIIIFLIAYYRLSGAVASAALIFYAGLIFAIFKLWPGFTLTLSAIGGFVLSLGMAVDANVLIFERMKEELWGGRTLGAAIEAGFNRAWPAIWDSNVTTVLAGIILFWLGSSNIASSAPVKGFALTLIIGVLCSMFTALTVTRVFLRPFRGTGLAERPSLFVPFQRKRNA